MTGGTTDLRNRIPDVSPRRGRPAETTSGVGSIGLLMAYILGVTDEQTVVCLGAALGLVPGTVTLLVSSGGLRGLVRLLWRGRGV